MLELQNWTFIQFYQKLSKKQAPWEAIKMPKGNWKTVELSKCLESYEMQIKSFLNFRESYESKSLIFLVIYRRKVVLNKIFPK